MTGSTWRDGREIGRGISLFSYSEAVPLLPFPHRSLRFVASPAAGESASGSKGERGSKGRGVRIEVEYGEVPHARRVVEDEDLRLHLPPACQINDLVSPSRVLGLGAQVEYWPVHWHDAFRADQKPGVPASAGAIDQVLRVSCRSDPPWRPLYHLSGRVRAADAILPAGWSLDPRREKGPITRQFLVYGRDIETVSHFRGRVYDVDQDAGRAALEVGVAALPDETLKAGISRVSMTLDPADLAVLEKRRVEGHRDWIRISDPSGEHVYEVYLDVREPAPVGENFPNREAFLARLKEKR